MTIIKTEKRVVTKTPFNSTNFTVQSLLLLLFAFLEFIGFPIPVAEDIKMFVEATILAATGFWGTIRTFFAKGIKFEFTGNVLTYLFAFVGGAVSWFSVYAGDLQGALAQLIDALTTGNFNLIFPTLFAVVNIIYRIIQDKPWQNNPAATA